MDGVAHRHFWSLAHVHRLTLMHRGGEVVVGRGGRIVGGVVLPARVASRYASARLAESAPSPAPAAERSGPRI